MTEPRKKSWIELTIAVAQYHNGQLVLSPKWRIEDSARELNRSTGSISQYLKLYDWIKSHPAQMESCDSMREALTMIGKIQTHQRRQEFGFN